ncbi:MAG: ribonuclease HII [Prevotella sp.]|nr:ribonuclease HII [Staphylococcus sp.]MCM1350449.1 ribonuclease HII [Prevotella sp.]
MRKSVEEMKENYTFETRYYAEGFQYIAGTDEVGRGPLAGPVVASAVIMPKGCYIEGVTDSKKLSSKKRKALRAEIEAKALSIVTVFIDEETIDQINIYEASRLAMQQAIKGLYPQPDLVLSDAMPLHMEIENLPIIKGDEKSFVIGCASIIAKEIRDDYMDILDKRYPGYGFSQNKGYPTKAHQEALQTQGVLPIHRKTYGPVARLLQNK